ncbi:stage VI sporulation protein F [Brevibacillus nitrificans]|uniref:stage VI sporulation protein F n=1 Tax=Brevibacillus nitrificans TaxID=651560 RepID=UPI002866FE6D|nr:stage VI sporulation protein F [Brevibacillus nitrificans]MDR7313992.1 protein-arginine kinase activator protein McsA [Brevibacillus nitrificans]
MNNPFSGGFLDRLKGKGTGTDKIDESKLRSLASQVKKSDFEDEAKLRQIIKTLAAMSGKQLTSEKEDKIIEMFYNQEINIHDMSSLTKLLK